jgi:hypothetical protein
MAAAEIAAKRAELELLQLLEAETNAKSSRSGRQREAGAGSCAAPASSEAQAILEVPAVQKDLRKMRDEIHCQRKEAFETQQREKNEKEKQHAQAEELLQNEKDEKEKQLAETKEVLHTREHEGVAQASEVSDFKFEQQVLHSKKKSIATASRKDKEKSCKRPTGAQVVKDAVTDAKEQKIAAMLDAVAKSTALNAKKCRSILSAPTTSGSSSPSPITSPAHYTRASVDRPDDEFRQEDQPCSPQQHLDVSRWLGKALAVQRQAELQRQADLHQNFNSRTVALPPPPPPPPCASHQTFEKRRQDGSDLADELRSIFPSANIHIFPPTSPHERQYAPDLPPCIPAAADTCSCAGFLSVADSGSPSEISNPSASSAAPSVARRRHH